MGHLQGLSDTHSIAIEKGNILNFQTENGVAFLPQDSEFINLWRKSTNASDIFTFGFDKVSDFRVSDINIVLDKNLTSFSLSFDGKKEDLCINGISFHNAMNAALSFGIAIYCERSVSQIKENLLSCELPQRRLSVFKSINDSTLIDDSYNSNPASLKNALDSLEGFKGKKICVLGEMKELGERSSEIHQEVLEYAKNKSDEMILLGDAWSSIDLDTRVNAQIFNSHDEICSYLVSVLDNNTILLVKGSRSTRMDLIADKLKK
jgi:UDP-N-acetylmuramoyl-tripeptide--D-alanyl-D-alanine ligase